MIRIIEDLTSKYGKIARVRGFVDKKAENNEELEIVIFRGFSSCTTHPTNYNETESVLPKGSQIVSGEIIKPPLNSLKEIVLLGPLDIDELIKEVNWRKIDSTNH